MGTNVADTVLTTILGLLAAATKLTTMKAQADAEGRALALADLQTARAADDVAAAELDAAITAHGG